VASASKEAAEEYDKLAQLATATLNEIDSQREQLDDSERLLKAAVKRLQAEHTSLDKKLATLRADQERRIRARKEGVCLSCGRAVTASDTFCDRCGTPLT